MSSGSVAPMLADGMTSTRKAEDTRTTLMAQTASSERNAGARSAGRLGRMTSAAAPVTPIASSTAAYARSGRRTRVSSRMAIRLPRAMPAMKADSTSALDHAPLPSASAEARNQRFSKISADAPDSDAMA